MIDSKEAPVTDEARLAGQPDVLPVPDAQVDSAASLDALDVEALILNMEAALKVHARPHFFAWTQGLLQSLLRHEVLICALRGHGQPAFRIDCFSSLVADAKVFSEPLMRDISLVPKLVEAWKDHHHLPLGLDTQQAEAMGEGPLARELERVGAQQIVVHGCHDAEGEAVSIFAFGCRAGTLSPRRLYLMQLVVPFLHAAWVRSQMHGSAHSLEPAQHGDVVVTAREQEILKWIYLGKSNSEIGLILGISPLTVKNHVQNLLRKLNVVNRAQAVGKALDARLLRP